MTRKLSTPFANDSTQKNVVPVTATQAQTDSGLASYSGGFGNKNMLPISNGGQPPYGQDFNGILNDITGNIVDINKGLPQYFDSDYAQLIGGYPIGARLMLNNNSSYVVSSIASNSNDPNSNLAGWDLQNTVTSLNTLTGAIKWMNRNVYIKGDGHYVSDGITWNKDDTYNLYDFYNYQPIEYYYKQLGDWDKAIYLAQANVYLKNYSPVLILPRGVVEVSKPILFNEALYFNLNKDYPELGLYNPDTGTFGGKDGKDNSYYTTPWSIIGAGKPSQIGEGYNPSKTTNIGIGGGTTISFVGGKSIYDDPSDMTFQNYGIIHACPEFGGVQNAIPKDYWENKDDLSGFNRIELKGFGVLGNARNIHCVVIWRSHWHLLSDLWLDDCYGAGLYMNWLYDLNIDRVVFTKCGRMSPNYQDFINDGLFDIQYQTYAPLHITAQRPSTDNSNHVGVFRPHFENNFRCVSDVIINGNSNPIWFNNAHHESGEPSVTTGAKKRVCYTAGKYGVQYFGKDSESGFDYKNQTFNESGGYINVNDCYGYTANYSHGLILSRFSGAFLNDFRFTAGVYVNGGDANCSLQVTNSSLGDVIIDGGFTNDFPIDISRSTLTSFSCNYLNNMKMISSTVTNGITLNNVNNQGASNGSIIENVKTKFISGDLRGGVIRGITFNDNTKQPIINSVGTITTIDDSSYFSGWLAE